MSDEKKNIYNKEISIVKNAQSVCSSNEILDINFLTKEFHSLTKNYELLLNEAKLVTSVSDRLQNKLNTANDKLKAQSEEIKKINKDLEVRNVELLETIDALTKARVGRKAATITIILAIILFLVSEGVIEPVVEANTNNQFIGFAFKGAIALLIKPLETIVESQMLKRATKKKTHTLPVAPK